MPRLCCLGRRAFILLQFRVPVVGVPHRLRQLLPLQNLRHAPCVFQRRPQVALDMLGYALLADVLPAGDFPQVLYLPHQFPRPHIRLCDQRIHAVVLDLVIFLVAVHALVHIGAQQLNVAVFKLQLHVPHHLRVRVGHARAARLDGVQTRNGVVLFQLRKGGVVSHAQGGKSVPQVHHQVFHHACAVLPCIYGKVGGRAALTAKPAPHILDLLCLHHALDRWTPHIGVHQLLEVSVALEPFLLLGAFQHHAGAFCVLLVVGVGHVVAHDIDHILRRGLVPYIKGTVPVLRDHQLAALRQHLVPHDGVAVRAGVPALHLPHPPLRGQFRPQFLRPGIRPHLLQHHALPRHIHHKGALAPRHGLHHLAPHLIGVVLLASCAGDGVVFIRHKVGVRLAVYVVAQTHGRQHNGGVFVKIESGLFFLRELLRRGRVEVVAALLADVKGAAVIGLYLEVVLALRRHPPVLCQRSVVMLYGMECLSADGRQLLQGWAGVNDLRSRPCHAVYHLGEHLGVGFRHTACAGDGHIGVSRVGAQHNALHQFQRLKVAVIAAENVRQLIRVAEMANAQPRPAMPTSYPPCSRSPVLVWASLSPNPVRSHTPCLSVAPLFLITSLAYAQ